MINITIRASNGITGLWPNNFNRRTHYILQWLWGLKDQNLLIQFIDTVSGLVRTVASTWKHHGNITCTAAENSTPAAFNPSTNLPAPSIISRTRYVTYRNMCKTGLTFFATFPSSTILTPNRENRSELSSHDFPYGLLGAPAVPSKPIRRLVEDVGAVSCWTR